MNTHMCVQVSLMDNIPFDTANKPIQELEHKSRMYTKPDLTLLTPLVAGELPSLSFLERRYDLRNVRILLRAQEANSGNFADTSAMILETRSRGWCEMGTKISNFCSMILLTYDCVKEVCVCVCVCV